MKTIKKLNDLMEAFEAVFNGEAVTFTVDGEVIHTIYGTTIFSSDGTHSTSIDYKNWLEIYSDLCEAYYDKLTNNQDY